MKTTLALIALTLSASLSTAAYAQAEPEIRVIGAGVNAGGAQDNIGAGSSEKRAQPATFYSDPSKSKDDMVRAFLVDYARCAYELDKRGAEKLMDMIPGTSAYTQMAKRMAANRCMAVGDTKFQHSSLQGALYIHRYKTEFGSRAPALSPDPIDYAKIAGNAEAPWGARYVAYRKLAQCVVRADPVASRAVVMGPVGSAQEAGAVQAISASLGGCLEKGATVALTKDRLVGIVAEALYRLSIRERAG